MKRDWSYLPAILSAVALLVFTVAFVCEYKSFKSAVIGWAMSDLSARSQLAAATLAEALTTDDFRRVRQFGEMCTKDGMRLLIRSHSGGVYYSTNPGDSVSVYWASSLAAGHVVSVGIPSEVVLRPFRRAMAGFVLAGLVGTAGVLLFFFVTYRQRVRIRELSRLEKFRRDFISDVSHEIKTPLTGIIGAVDILDEGEALPLEDRAGALAMIRRESLRLNALVQNILTLSRLEHYNENGFEFADADLAEIAEDSVRRFENRAKARGVKLTLIVNSTCVVKCDAAQISRALDNLINNAIVHSSATEVKVQLSQSHKYGLLAVQDNGRGIPLEHQARIFDRFYRVDSSRGQETGGAGLGLSIVHAIASLHGGTVRFEALKPAGCSFTLQLPR